MGNTRCRPRRRMSRLNRWILNIHDPNKFGGTVTGMMVRPGHHFSTLQHLVITHHHTGFSDARWSRKTGIKSSEPWRLWRFLCGVFLFRDVCLRHLARICHSHYCLLRRITESGIYEAVGIAAITTRNYIFAISVLQTIAAPTQ